MFGVFSNPVVNPLDLAYLAHLTEDERLRQQAIIKARQYHDDIQLSKLTSRLREFVSSDVLLILNVTRTVTLALVERLIVTGLRGEDVSTVDWGWRLWQSDRMNVKHDELMEMAVRDGEAFVIVEWDDERGQPTFIPNQRYTDPQLRGGDGEGCKIFYADDDYFSRALRATKRWTQLYTDPHGSTRARQRINIYYPDRIEKFAYDGGWVAWRDPLPDGNDEPWPIWWTDNGAENGEPLGIPVIHFRNRALRCEARSAWSLQDVINKALIDYVSAGDKTAFRILYTLGFVPTTDGRALNTDLSNQLKIEPGTVISTLAKTGDASVGVIDPPDMTALERGVMNQLQWVAMVTDTPTKRFQITAAVSSSETIAASESALVAKIENRQSIFSSAYTDLFALAARLQNRFGDTTVSALPLTPIWKPAQPQDPKSDLEKLLLKQSLGVPRSVLWAEAGYSAAQISEMVAMVQAEENARLQAALADTVTGVEQ